MEASAYIVFLLFAGPQKPSVFGISTYMSWMHAVSILDDLCALSVDPHVGINKFKCVASAATGSPVIQETISSVISQSSGLFQDCKQFKQVKLRFRKYPIERLNVALWSDPGLQISRRCSSPLVAQQRLLLFSAVLLHGLVVAWSFSSQANAQRHRVLNFINGCPCASRFWRQA